MLGEILMEVGILADSLQIIFHLTIWIKKIH